MVLRAALGSLLTRWDEYIYISKISLNGGVFRIMRISHDSPPSEFIVAESRARALRARGKLRVQNDVYRSM